MAQVIEGKFRRVKRQRGEAPPAPAAEGLGGVAYTYDVDGQPVLYDIPDPVPGAPPKIPLGVQAWEYLHQSEVQTENVILTGTNNPGSMQENVFYQIENDIRGGVDAAAAAAQKVLDTGSQWAIWAAVAFVLYTVFNGVK